MKIYIIKQQWLFPHDLAPQYETYHTAFKSKTDANNALMDLFNQDMELELFCDEDGETYLDGYTIGNGDYFSTAEIVELNLE